MRVVAVALVVLLVVGCAESSTRPVDSPRPAVACERSTAESLRYAVLQESERGGCLRLWFTVDTLNDPPMERMRGPLLLFAIDTPSLVVSRTELSCVEALATAGTAGPWGPVDVQGGFVEVLIRGGVSMATAFTLSASIDMVLDTGESDTLRIDSLVLRDRDDGVESERCDP